MIERIRIQLDEIQEELRSLRLAQSEYLSLEQAAEYLKISKSTLYKHTSAGNISHFKPNGKLILFQRRDLDNWLTKARVPSNEELGGI